MTKEEIQQRYTQLCLALGELEANFSINREAIIAEIRTLNDQQRSLMIQEAATEQLKQEETK